ncbi:hypothetical protein GCM10010515_43380 [Streptomyces fructofermentans]|uniref:Uncharacterized protein n=1 Tax=Streptomyces fructofermentans TaxID=152141 RepID=A0A918KPI2_9ACTN|nr:hypothetical protein GCM10010515_43380 [Streptomyces fructofermentans]
MSDTPSDDEPREAQAKDSAVGPTAGVVGGAGAGAGADSARADADAEAGQGRKAGEADADADADSGAGAGDAESEGAESEGVEAERSVASGAAGVRVAAGSVRAAAKAADASGRNPQRDLGRGRAGVPEGLPGPAVESWFADIHAAPPAPVMTATLWSALATGLLSMLMLEDGLALNLLLVAIPATFGTYVAARNAGRQLRRWTVVWGVAGFALLAIPLLRDAG